MFLKKRNSLLVKKKSTTTWYYTPILNFYECTTQLEEKPLNKIIFNCLICAEKTLYSKLGRTNNLNRHLKDDHKKHSKLVDWLKKYDQFNSRAKEKADNIDR